MDSQSVKGAETVSKAPRAFDAGKKINGRKRHIAYTLGLPVMITVTPADTTDRDAARELLWRLPDATADHPDLGLLRLRRPASTCSDDFLHMTLKTLVERRDSSSCPAAGKSNAPWAGS